MTRRRSRNPFRPRAVLWLAAGAAIATPALTRAETPPPGLLRFAEQYQETRPAPAEKPPPRKTAPSRKTAAWESKSNEKKASRPAPLPEVTPARERLRQQQALIAEKTRTRELEQQLAQLQARLDRALVPGETPISVMPVPPCAAGPGSAGRSLRPLAHRRARCLAALPG